LTPVLTTARLELRPLAPDDAGSLHAIYGDPRAMAWWDTPALPEFAATAAMIGRQMAAVAEGTHAYWTARWRQDAAVVGGFDLSEIAPPQAEVGSIVAPAFWRQGLAREAMMAVLDYGRVKLGLTQFSARYHAGNAASAALLTSLGFGAPRLLPAAVVRDGEARDCLVCDRRI